MIVTHCMGLDPPPPPRLYSLQLSRKVISLYTSIINLLLKIVSFVSITVLIYESHTVSKYVRNYIRRIFPDFFPN